MTRSLRHDEPREVSYAEFVNSELNSLTWYDLLPGDPVVISGISDTRGAGEIARLLTESDPAANQAAIDLLAARLLNEYGSIEPGELWPELACRLSGIMATNLHAQGDRALRMRVQRLIYYLQTLIDREKPEDHGEILLAESNLDGSKPWDYLRTADGEWWLASGRETIHYRRMDGEGRSWEMGLPTQIDILAEGMLAFGSLYTDGASLWDGEAWRHIEHESPVVLVFDYDDQRYLLDHGGNLWRDRPRQRWVAAPRPQVHFARFFDHSVYLLDNSDFGHLTIIDVESGAVQRQPVLPVQVCNDLVRTEQAYYLIDKQQGSVFKFDHDWNYQQRVLRFGRGEACLLDPVALRCYRDRLLVVSWLSARLTELRLF